MFRIREAIREHRAEIGRIITSSTARCCPT